MAGCMVHGCEQAGLLWYGGTLLCAACAATVESESG